MSDMLKLTFAILLFIFYISHAFLFLHPYCLLLYKWIFLQCNVLTPLMDVQPGFRKGGGTRDQIANIHWIIEKAKEFQKNIYFCSIDYAKAFDCVDHHKLWKILEEIDGNTRPPDLLLEKSVRRSGINS